MPCNLSMTCRDVPPAVILLCRISSLYLSIRELLLFLLGIDIDIDMDMDEDEDGRAKRVFVKSESCI